MRVIELRKGTKHFEKMMDGYRGEPINMKGLKWVSKSQEPKNLKLINPPMSMDKLIGLLDKDEYHYACVDAISESCFVKFECKNQQVKTFFENVQLPNNEDVVSILSDFVHYYIACGNGFLLKMRSVTGQWVGLNRLIPSEVQIVENYDDYGFLRPNYLQVKAGQKAFFYGKDIIHMLQRNSISNAWGVACKPIILNCEILQEIKQYDFNRFKNGLLLDYFIVIEGGSIGKKYTEIDEITGETKTIDPLAIFEESLKQAKGNINSHGSILLELDDPNAKMKLEPMRINGNDFEPLKKELRDAILVYHRVPHRLTSIETPGRLSGDNNSDMQVFYNMVIKPLQYRVAYILAREFKAEFGWDVKAEDFDFGNISEILESFESRLLKA